MEPSHHQPQHPNSAQRSPPTASSSSTTSNATADVDYADIDRKQLELRTAVEHRIATLERTLLARDHENSALRAQLRKLEEDYTYNYQLIGERDAALEEAAGHMQRLHRELQQSQGHLEQSQQTVEALERQRGELVNRNRQLELSTEEKLREVRRQMEAIQLKHQQALAEKDATIAKEREEAHERYLSRTTDDDRARSAALEAVQQTLRDAENAAKRREDSLKRECQEAQRAVEAARRDAESAHNERAELNRQFELLTAAHSALQHDVEERDERLQRMQNLSHQRDAQLAASTRTAETRVTELTVALQQLEVEVQELRTERTQRLLQMETSDAQRSSDAAMFREACQEIRRQHEETSKLQLHEIAQLREKLRVKDAAVVELERNLATSSTAQERQAVAATGLKSRIAELENELHAQGLELDRLRREASESRQRSTQREREEADAEDRRQQETRDLHRTVERLTTELDRLRGEEQRKQQQLQSDAARLSRELSASEAARNALESQLALLRDDGGGLRSKFEQLLVEKRQREERIVQLEQMNEAIRGQVDAFTKELCNDPVVKDAKLSAQRVVELESALLVAQQQIANLEQTLRDQREEVRRYQEKILEVDQGSSKLAFELREAQRELSSQRGEWADKFQLLQQQQLLLQHQVHLEHQQQQQQQQQAASSRRTSLSPPSPTAPPPTAPQPQTTNTTVVVPPAGFEESELWHRRVQQLEHSLRQALLERDDALQEKMKVTQALRSAQIEIKSVLEVNNMLKAQLRQSYADAALVQRTKMLHQQHHQQQQQNQLTTTATAAAPYIDPVPQQPLEVDRVVLEQRQRLDQHPHPPQHHHYPQQPQQQQYSVESSRHTRPVSPSPQHHHQQQQENRSPHSYQAPSAKPSSFVPPFVVGARSSSSSSSSAGLRVLGQAAAPRARGEGGGNAGVVERDPSSGAVVHRRGSQAVRHYGTAQ